MSEKGDNWLYEISSKKKLIDLNFREIWRYRDLLVLFVKRDIVTVYKQTILGPLWFLIQPLFTSIVFTLVFNNLGGIGTNGVPPFLFNLTGITAWNYFKNCLTGTSNTFKSNQNIFGKVYFPRVIVPMSITVSNLFKFGIQLIIFVGFFMYFSMTGSEINVNYLYLGLFPFYIIMIAALGLGFGMTISALTTKYRDLNVLVSFAVALLMYVSAVPYPLSEATNKLPQRVSELIVYNPLAQIMEGFRFMLLKTSETPEIFNWNGFIGAFTFSICMFFIGLIIFNRTEKSFIDTV